ncbi:hypothetical protein VTN77DRAFT_1593 [Rasamsonia byssochlamydoides]|uniref:uncharacterized protein n=1 Tax=Rasamsonia byssochlamydoides TaxID=89139 RepID=UPI003742874B
MHWLFVLSLHILPASTALLGQQANLGFSPRGFCGTGAPSELLRAEHKRLSSIEVQRVKGDDGSRETLSPIQIDTWFHIVSTNDQVDLVTDDMIMSQFSYLQRAYANTSISYKLVGVDRSINDTWARNGDDLGMKRTLRKGTYRTLNIYFQTDLQVSPGSSISARDDNNNNSIGTFPMSPQFASNLLGFCTLPNPKINASSPPADYIEDGCNILAATMPGGSIAHYNLGGTTIHEVGHWNGLLHTFQGETCDSDGDYIPDTPFQSVPTDGCPATKDSCPNSPGLDAIHNFMDYSSDDCYQGFTNDQASRMRNMWSLMREGK